MRGCASIVGNHSRCLRGGGHPHEQRGVVKCRWPVAHTPVAVTSRHGAAAVAGCRGRRAAVEIGATLSEPQPPPHRGGGCGTVVPAATLVAGRPSQVATRAIARASATAYADASTARMSPTPGDCPPPAATLCTSSYTSTTLLSAPDAIALTYVDRPVGRYRELAVVAAVMATTPSSRSPIVGASRRAPLSSAGANACAINGLVRHVSSTRGVVGRAGRLPRATGAATPPAPRTPSGVSTAGGKPTARKAGTKLVAVGAEPTTTERGVREGRQVLRQCSRWNEPGPRRDTARKPRHETRCL